MSVAELIDQVMHRVRVRFYSDRPVREWVRDRNALLKAVARYGHECTQRGWRFEADDLAGRLVALLNRIERPGGEGWFPKYLEAAVDQHVRERSEEIQAAARRAETITAKALAGLPPVSAVRPPSASEMLGAVWAEQRRRQQDAAARLKAGSLAAKAQQELFGKAPKPRTLKAA